MSVTYHHYGATVLNAPVDHLRHDMFALLNVPQDSVRTAGRATGSADAASAELSRPCLPLAMQIGDTTVLEEVIDRVSGTHALTYRSTTCAPEIAEYVATCTLQSMTPQRFWSSTTRWAVHEGAQRVYRILNFVPTALG